MSLPDCLAPFRDELEPFKRDFIRVEPRTVWPYQSYYDNYHIERSILDVHVSKFLGKPYWPAKMDFPRRANDGRHMILVAQINFSEVPRLEDFPRTGLLQLFVCAGEDDYALWGGSGNHRIVFHENISGGHLTDFSFLIPDQFVSSPINMEAALFYRPCVEYGGFDDINFDFNFRGLRGGDLHRQFREQYSREQQSLIEEVLGGRHEKIGGYASFTQRDPRQKHGDILVLQIDGFAEAFHGGTGHIFMPSQALRDRDFSKAYFHHDNS